MWNKIVLGLRIIALGLSLLMIGRRIYETGAVI